MLVPVYRKLKNGREYEECLDTDDLLDKDYVEFSDCSPRCYQREVPKTE